MEKSIDDKYPENDWITNWLDYKLLFYFSQLIKWLDIGKLFWKERNLIKFINIIYLNSKISCITFFYSRKILKNFRKVVKKYRFACMYNKNNLTIRLRTKSL